MDLLQLLEHLEILAVHGTRAREIAGICYDSRRCGPDFLFVAVRGLAADGHLFVPEAVRRGAKAVVYDGEIARHPNYTAIQVKDSRRALGILGKTFYEDPSSRIGMIGVTGTNGKTTVTWLLESMLREAGREPAVIGTVNYRYAGKTFPAPNTTPESFELQRLMHDIREAGATDLVMEVSSHALALARVEDCDFDCGIFMNLTQDHLDFHGTMEAYFASKRRFFTDLLAGEKNGRRRGRIVNTDDPWGERLIAEIGPEGAVTFGIDNPAAVRATNVRLSIEDIRADIETPVGTIPIEAPLIGRFNLYNILAAAAAATFLGLPPDAIRRGVQGIRAVPGRLEKISRPGEPAVFVDYAHTDDALRRVLQNLGRFRKGRLIAVFGCGGDRDRGKRPLMGRAAAEESDIAIVTSDNPRSEDPIAIIGEIEAGMDGRMEKSEADGLKTNQYAVVPDRRAAIGAAVSMATPDDIVLIAGKGHEDYQIIGKERLAFDDRVAGREALDNRKGNA